jgi:hypothetical protein
MLIKEKKTWRYKRYYKKLEESLGLKITSTLGMTFMHMLQKKLKKTSCLMQAQVKMINYGPN